MRGDIERLQFRVVAEIHGGESGALLGTLSSAQDERHRRSAWSVALECFLDGTAQLNCPIGVQEFEELRGLATRRFSTGESGVEQGLAFRHCLGQATTGVDPKALRFSSSSSCW